MKPRRVTLRHIAAHVGVHPSTVSRVLNPERRGLVSREVVERVDQAVRQLGYYPNRAANGLRTNRSSTIGIVVSDVSHPFFPKLIAGIQDVMIENGYSCVVCSSDQRPERKRRIIEVIRKHQFDGLILLATERVDPLVVACRQDRIPVAVLERGAAPPSAPAVHLDDRSGVRQVMDHLVALGHTRIAVVSGPQRFSGAFSRHRLVVAEMTKRALTIDPALIATCETYSTSEGARRCDAFLASGSRFTAVVTANDLLAIGCAESLKRHGIACPGAVSVVGYNDIGLGDKTAPPLTTVRFDQDELGSALAGMLLRQLREEDAVIPYRQVEPTLVIRGSTAPAPAAS